MIDGIALDAIRAELLAKLNGCSLLELIDVAEMVNGAIAERATEMLTDTSVSNVVFDYMYQVKKDAEKASGEALRLGLMTHDALIG